MGYNVFEMKEKGEAFVGRFCGHKFLKSRSFDAGEESSAPAVTEMALYHFSGGAADVRIGRSGGQTLGDGEEYDTIYAAPRVKVRWRARTAVTVSVLTGTRAVMEVFSPV